MKNIFGVDLLRSAIAGKSIAQVSEELGRDPHHIKVIVKQLLMSMRQGTGLFDGQPVEGVVDYSWRWFKDNPGAAAKALDAYERAKHLSEEVYEAVRCGKKVKVQIDGRDISHAPQA